MFEWSSLWGNPDLGMASVGDLPYIKIGEITSDLMHIHTVIVNEGLADAMDVEWSIDITGGLFGMINSSTSGIIDSLAIGEEQSVQSDTMIFGLGVVHIIVTADIWQKDAEGLVFGPFILV
jgi:hypothetical protein